MLDTGYMAWRVDLATGHNTVLVAATNEEAAALNLRAQVDPFATGEVARLGVEFHDGGRALTSPLRSFTQQA